MTATVELHTHNLNSPPRCSKCKKEAMAIDIAFPNERGGKSSKTYFFCRECFHKIHKKVIEFLDGESYEIIAENINKTQNLNQRLQAEIKKQRELNELLEKEVDEGSRINNSFLNKSDVLRVIECIKALNDALLDCDISTYPYYRDED